MTGLQWVASEAWTLLEGLQISAFTSFLGGTLGIAVRRGEIPGLRDFLLRIHPDQHNISENSMVRASLSQTVCNKSGLKLFTPVDNFLNQIYTFVQVKLFWEHTFQCKFPLPAVGLAEDAGAQCTGREDLNSVTTDLLNVSELRPEYNIYKAVYALAHALHDMLSCIPGRGPFRGNRCASLQTLELWQVRSQFKMYH